MDILGLLEEKYHPETVILYGSYADCTNNQDSDFDALLIGDALVHDTSAADGIRLDVFVYPADYFEQEYAIEDFLQLYHGKIIRDDSGRGQALLDAVKRYVDTFPRKERQELSAELDWCRKMLLRSRRGDAEGMYRWHWLLCDSLEIYADLRGCFYFGPKKTLLWMQETDPESFRLYCEALSGMREDALEGWVNRLNACFLELGILWN